MSFAKCIRSHDTAVFLRRSYSYEKVLFLLFSQAESSTKRRTRQLTNSLFSWSYQVASLPHPWTTRSSPLESARRSSSTSRSQTMRNSSCADTQPRRHSQLVPAPSFLSRPRDFPSPRFSPLSEASLSRDSYITLCPFPSTCQ